MMNKKDGFMWTLQKNELTTQKLRARLEKEPQRSLRFRKWKHRKRDKKLPLTWQIKALSRIANEKMRKWVPQYRLVKAIRVDDSCIQIVEKEVYVN
jgi:hypothetical protein